MELPDSISDKSLWELVVIECDNYQKCGFFVLNYVFGGSYGKKSFRREKFFGDFASSSECSKPYGSSTFRLQVPDYRTLTDDSPVTVMKRQLRGNHFFKESETLCLSGWGFCSESWQERAIGEITAFIHESGAKSQNKVFCKQTNG